MKQLRLPICRSKNTLPNKDAKDVGEVRTNQVRTTRIDMPVTARLEG